MDKQQIAGASLGATQEEILRQFGNPLKESQEHGVRVLWYTSKAPSIADYLYVENGRVVRISLSYYENPKLFNEYIALYGMPERSIEKLRPGIHDSLRQTIHIWPKEGKAVTTIGAYTDSQVIREDTLATMTLNQYMADLAGNQETSVVGTLMQTVQPGQLQPERSPMDAYIGVAVILAILVIITGIILYIIRKRKKNIVH